MRPDKPYLFDRWFEAVPTSGLPLSASAAEHVESAAPTYTGEEMQRARAEGIALGRAEAIGEFAIERESERRRQDTLDAVAERVGELLAKTAQAAEQAGRDALIIAGAIARKLLPRCYREHACSEIQGLVASILARIQDQPTLIVRVFPALVAELAPGIEAAMAASGHEQRVRVIGDDSVAEGDCRIEWSGGGVIRDQALLWREIDALMAECTGSIPPSPATRPDPCLPTGEHHA